MSDIFIKIFNLGMTAGWIVLAVLLLRPLLRKAPKWIRCLLWGIVGLRLIFPFSLESIFSLIPSAEPLPEDIMMSPTPAINSGIGVINNTVNPIISDSMTPGIGTSVNPMQLAVAIGSWLWVIGIALMLIYGAVSYIRLALRVRVSIKYRDNIYYCDEVDSPFILGVIRPRIYLPSGMCGEEMGYVIGHEEAHLKRRDHLWKPLAFVLLAVYWFNPLLWVAYALLCRDIEMACDEKVIKEMDSESKKGYSEALVACSVHRRSIMACPLAFGEVGVKERIKSVLNYKKPAFWIIVVALVATVIVSVCFLTNPIKEEEESSQTDSKIENIDDTAIYDSAIYDTATFDIDGDGKEEICSVGVGPTSGLFTFTFRACEQGSDTNEYYNVFYSDWMEFEFVKSDDGKFRLQGTTQDGKVRVYDVGIEDGQIILTREGETLTGSHFSGTENSKSDDEANNAQPVFDSSYSFYDSSRKYDVYVWQMAKGSFSFGLLESKTRTWLDDELLSIKGVGASEMRQILLEKNLGPDDVNIVRWQNPLSSYIGDFWVLWPYMNDNTPQENFYYAIVYDMLFGTSPRRYYPTATESESFDIDGDGVKEDNRIFLGLVDGKFMFRYIISEDNKTAAYDDTFYTEPMSLKFFTADGKLRLRGVTEDGGVHIYEIRLENGHVKLNEIESTPIADASNKTLDLSKADFSLVDRIVVTNGQTGAVKYMNTTFNRDLFNNMMTLLETVKAGDPVSNRGYYGFSYHVELYYDYQTVFSFSLYNDESDGASIICGYYETVDGFNYPCRYKLTNPTYEKINEALGKYFK